MLQSISSLFIVSPNIFRQLELKLLLRLILGLIAESVVCADDVNGFAIDAYAEDYCVVELALNQAQLLNDILLLHDTNLHGPG